MCSFPLQSLILTWAVANSTQAIGDSFSEWYVAWTFPCGCDTVWFLLVCSCTRSLFLWSKVWCHFPHMLHPWEWQSLITCLLLKQLMHNLLFLTILYFSSLGNCLNVLHCDVGCESFFDYPDWGFSSVVRQMPGLNSQVGARSALLKSSCHCVVLSSLSCYCVVLLFLLFCYYGVVLCIDCVYCNTVTGC